MAKKLIDSIGIEFEVEDILREEFIPPDIKANFRREPDASIEKDVYPKKGFLLDRPVRNERDKVISGVEFVSQVLDSTNMDAIKKPVYSLVNWLSEKGESLESFRAGIHVHVNLGGYNLYILRNLMKLSAKYEALFYYLGSMGYEFRGVRNDCTYCRPVTLYGPSCILIGRKNIQIMNMKDLLESNSTEEFFFRYGGLTEENPPRKYTPIRYGWITLYNLLTEKRTVEFRVFNKSLNPEYILAMVTICKAFCSRSMSSIPVTYQENSIYTTPKEKIEELFDKMAEEFLLDSKTVTIGKYIISRCPEIKLEPKYYYSHLKNPDFNYNVPYNYKEIEEKVYSPNYVDIHVLRGE